MEDVVNVEAVVDVVDVVDVVAVVVLVVVVAVEGTKGREDGEDEVITGAIGVFSISSSTKSWTKARISDDLRVKLPKPELVVDLPPKLERSSDTALRCLPFLRCCCCKC